MISKKEYPIDNELLERNLNTFLDEWQIEIDKHGLQEATLDEKDSVRPTKSRSYGKVGEIFMHLIDVLLCKDQFIGFPEDTKELMRDEALFDCIRSIRRWDRKQKAISYFYVIARTACNRTLTRYHYKKRLNTVEYSDDILAEEVISYD